MQFRKLWTDDDAVSPVIGVILMVAITVILAAVIGAFVLGFGGGGPSAPTASWDSAETDVSGNDGNVTFTASSVSDEFDANTLSIAGNDVESTATVTAGTEITVELSGSTVLEKGEEVSLVWSEDGSSSTLATHTLEDINGTAQTPAVN